MEFGENVTGEEIYNKMKETLTPYLNEATNLVNRLKFDSNIKQLNMAKVRVYRQKSILINFPSNEFFYGECESEQLINDYEKEKRNEILMKYDFALAEIQRQLELENIEPKQTSCFKTTLSRDERLIVCDKIIADKGGKIEAGIDKRLFIGIEEKHKPTLMYLLGGECPPKIIKLNMVSHPKMYKYLLGYSAHYYNGIKCLPVKIRENFLPKLLNDNKGKRITKLNNNIEPNNK